MILFLLGKVYPFLKNSTTKQKKFLRYRKRSLAITIYQIVIATAPVSLGFVVIRLLINLDNIWNTVGVAVDVCFDRIKQIVKFGDWNMIRIFLLLQLMEFI